MDEPTSALDPGSTLRIEDLMAELKKDYTVVIVTHNMQQASRISDRTAFFLLGELIEYGDDITDLYQSFREEDRRIHHRTFWLIWAALFAAGCLKARQFIWMPGVCLWYNGT